jgi:DNA polymerase-3 subunit epsilon
MRRSIDQLRERGQSVSLVELAQELLAISAPPDPALARSVVSLTLGRPAASLPERLDASDLRPGFESAVAALRLDAADYVIVDLETTGLAVQSAAILEIGAVRISGLKLVERFETLVRPPGKVPPAIVRLTGIHDAMVAEAPTARQAVRRFRSWLDRTPNAPFVAHNAGFDYGFTVRAFEQCGFDPYPVTVLCTRMLSRRLLPELGRYNLDHVCAHFGISNRARHRALGDAVATAHAWIELVEIAVARWGLRTVGDLIDMQRRPPKRRKRRRRTVR